MSTTARTVLNPKSTGTIKFATSEANLVSDPIVGTFQVQALTVVPRANLAPIPATFGAAASDSAAASSHELRVSLLQDWGQVDSVSQFLWDNDGEVVWFTYDPAASGVPSITGSCYAVAGTYGGSADENWVDDLTMPCPEKPDIA